MANTPLQQQMMQRAAMEEAAQEERRRLVRCRARCSTSKGPACCAAFSTRDAVGPASRGATMKVINPEGEAALLEAARSRGWRSPAVDRGRRCFGGAGKGTGQGAQGSCSAGGLRGAAETFAEEIVAWVMQSEVFFDHCTDDDIILEIQSEGDGLFTVTVLDMLLLEVEIMDNADVVQRRRGLWSSRVHPAAHRGEHCARWLTGSSNYKPDASGP